MNGGLDLTFGALAHPARRGMLTQLRRGETSVTALAAPHAMSLPAVSRHLKVLEEAGLIARTVDGRVHRIRLVAGPARRAARWLEEHDRFWNENLDALGDYVDALGERPNRKKKEALHDRTAKRTRRTTTRPRT